MPNPPRSSAWPVALTLAAGLAVGFTFGTVRPRPLLATGPDRSGESVLLSAPIRTEQNASSKIQYTLDAVYYLNYSCGRLLAAFPDQKQTVDTSQFLTPWAERDLLADFHLSPRANVHFVTTVGAAGAWSEGWSPLYVLETSTGQVAVYHAVQDLRTRGPRIDLVEIRRDPRLARAVALR